MMNKKQKVLVAMSGGVDSSVAAALLKQQGYDVVGLHMKFWAGSSDSCGKEKENRCCDPEAEKRARSVAGILKIPFYSVCFEREFKKKIVDYFLSEYQAGRTPNPCVLCNKEIKFGLLLKKAMGLGIDLVATGHYARIEPSTNNEFNTNKRIKKFVNSQQIRYSLITPKDENKDQTYFLWQLNQEQLKHILFPLADFTKPETRLLAKKFGLPTADAKESQEVCFIQNTTEDFLRKYLREKPGKIKNKEGEVLGKHKGPWFYTIGQRKGIGLSEGPYFVIAKNIKKNELVVSQDENDLLQKELVAEKVNWISGLEPHLPLKVQAKIRYRTPSASAVIKKLSADKYQVIFIKFQCAITPGQSVVFYDRNELLGGGIIH